MQAGPLRQVVAVLGLLALTPTMVYTALGRLTAGEAALRALITFAVVVVVGRAVAMALRFYVRLVERGNDQHVERRRSDDRAV